jgi:hypothetical protein
MTRCRLGVPGCRLGVPVGLWLGFFIPTTAPKQPDRPTNTLQSTRLRSEPLKKLPKQIVFLWRSANVSDWPWERTAWEAAPCRPMHMEQQKCQDPPQQSRKASRYSGPARKAPTPL